MTAETATLSPAPCVFVIDDDDAVRDALSMFLAAEGFNCRSFSSADEFLRFREGDERGCLILDVRMAGTSGIELQQELRQLDSHLPIIFLTGHGDVPMAVDAMRQGAFDFLRKPVNENDLLNCVRQALEQEDRVWGKHCNMTLLRARAASLTAREAEIFGRVAEGSPNKAIAIELGISERTVEVHRAQVMKKLGVRTLAELVRSHLALSDRADARGS